MISETSVLLFFQGAFPWDIGVEFGRGHASDLAWEGVGHREDGIQNERGHGGECRQKKEPAARGQPRPLLNIHQSQRQSEYVVPLGGSLSGGPNPGVDLFVLAEKPPGP